MKIELKNIQYSEKLSEETNAFSANLFIEGIKAGTASNRGHGGPTSYKADDKNGKKLIDKAEVYCKSLPPEKFSEGGRDHELKMDLEMYIDNMLGKYLQEKEMHKFQRKLEKAMITGIVAGVPDNSFEVWQFTLPIEKILQRPEGPEFIKNTIIKDVIPVLTEGKIILNTNISQKLLEESGLKKNQYVELVSKEIIVAKPEKKPGRRL